MKAIYLLLGLCLMTVGTACSQSPVSGTITVDSPDVRRVVYLLEPQSFKSLVSSLEARTIDSAIIAEDGSFRFNSIPASAMPAIYLIAVQNKAERYSGRLHDETPELSNYIPFVYDKNDRIVIHASADALLKTALIESQNTINQNIADLIKTRTELHDKYLANSHEADEEYLLDYEKSLLEFQTRLVQSAETVNSVHVKALALRWASVSGDYERIPELVKSTCQGMQKIDPQHPWTREVCAKAATLPLVPGDAFPDYTLPMQDGSKQQLHKLLGKKLTIIDLWASWCAPCRKENRNVLVPLWDKFHDQGLQIIGYALDADKTVWTNAIRKDGADRWPHASELKGDESDFLAMLKLSTIPANYILDEKATIVAKNLHGKELSDWVRAYMNR